MNNYSEPSVEMLVMSYGFSDIQELFDYIYSSRKNGQHSQAKRIFNELPETSQTERWEFFKHLEFYYTYGMKEQEIKEFIAEWKKYLDYTGPKVVTRFDKYIQPKK